MANQHHAAMEPQREAYSQRGNPTFDVAMSVHTASHQAAFFLPYLRTDMRLLDIGCGPGSITPGLAEAVAPGEVIGIDLRPEPIAGRPAPQRGSNLTIAPNAPSYPVIRAAPP
jgi:ubiquinone/menaquinone biosynthesis C-methylase UbiE